MPSVHVDWADWSFGPGKHPIMGAAMSGATALSVTAVGHGWLPAFWPAVAGLVLGMAAALSAAWQRMPGVVAGYRLVCVLAAGVWAACTLAWSSPWSRWPLILLATGTALAAVVGTGLARADRKDLRMPAVVPAVRPRLAVKWEARIRRITRREVTVVKAWKWDPPTGFTLDVTLPADGTTVMDLKAFQSQLAAAANLPPGCNVEVLPSDRGRRMCTVKVATVNAMADVQALPGEVWPLTVADPLPIGVHADGSIASIHLRYACCVLVGQTDSGKSNTLNVITHQLVRCTDTLVWAIDLTGRFPWSWIRPWVEGRADRPALDWVATTAAEAVDMVQAALRIISGRPAAYRRLMAEADDDKLPVSPQVPEIVIVADEFADLPSQIKEALEAISNTGRGMGVRLVTSVLRAVGADISRAMIAQARERIGMRVTDEAELQYLFDTTWSRGRFDPAATPWQGSGLVSTGAEVPEPFKAWRLVPSRIDMAAVTVRRPAADGVSAELAGPAYQRRWEHTLAAMVPGTPAGPPAPATATTTALKEKEEPKVDLEDSAANLERAVEAARRAREAADAQQPEPEVEPDWETVEGWLADATTNRPAPRLRMRQIVGEHRRDGIMPDAVWQRLQSEGHATTKPTVITWMRADAQAGILAQPGGERTPYVPGGRFTEEQP